jgi:GNAT superfamily N-acetyltransferase
VQDSIHIRPLDVISEVEIQALSDVLIDCVEGGASVGFMQPLTRAKANTFWRGVAASVACGERNQPHRADVAKMLVHRQARRCGLGAALLGGAERAALDAGRTLLVLDTASEDAERLYVKSGWKRCGIIPDFALLPGGGLCDTTFFYRTLK